MKMKTIVLALICAIAAGTLTIGCDSDRQKELNAEQKVRDAKKDLATLRQEQRDEAHRLKMEKEWENYKADCELVIASNDKQIVELENAILSNKKNNNLAYIARINELKIENEQLKTSLKNYKVESDITAWEAFKTEVNHDMQALADAFKDITINNTN